MDKGKDFLHNHPGDARRLGLDKDHVIVDRDSWEFARACFDDSAANAIIGKPKKRYFIVFYRLFRVGGGFNVGYSNVETKGEYLNYKEISVKIKDGLNKDIEKDKNKVESILILNIIELNESDYKDWVK